jgi:hypothetical protein
MLSYCDRSGSLGWATVCALRILSAQSLLFLVSICLMYARMRDYGCGAGLVWWCGVLTWWYGSFSLRFVCKTGLGVLCAGFVLGLCSVYVLQ